MSLFTARKEGTGEFVFCEISHVYLTLFPVSFMEDRAHVIEWNSVQKYAM
jgi:hypothetical protein